MTNSVKDKMLELVSVAVVHQFVSSDWSARLTRKLPMPNKLFDQVSHFESGEALMIAKQTELSTTMPAAAQRFYRMRIERRTQDAGRSVTA